MLALCSVSSITANTNSTKTTETPNGNALKSFSCEWKDLEFPITYGPGIAASLCVLTIAFVISTQNSEDFRLSQRFVVISYIIPLAVLGYITLYGKFRRKFISSVSLLCKIVA